MMLLRRFVVLLASLVFLTTSVGWSMASALAPLGSGKGHHSAIEAAGSSGHHDHSQQTVELASDCDEADSCGADSWHDALADSCCAMACHVAMPANSCATIFMTILRLKDPALLEDGIKEASSARLERPPRSAAA
jgi:hypothetical protein